MSLTAWIDISFEDDTVINYSSLIADLLAGGWAIGFDGQAMYLPLGDIDEFGWELIPIGDFDLQKYLDEKAIKSERIGLSMTYKETQSGGEFVLFQNRISFSITINPVMDDVIELPNLNWYLHRILPFVRLSFSRLDCVVAP